MDYAALRNGQRGLFEGIYRVIMRRNSVYVTFVIAGAFLGERVVDYGVHKLWEDNNVGGIEFHCSLSVLKIVMLEARRAAEKAYDVAKVDERVNKAIAAANRASYAAGVVAVKAFQKQMHRTNNNDNIRIPILVM